MKNNFDQLVAAAKARHYIAPELIVAAYQGMHVDKIDEDFLARVDETHIPTFVLDDEMRLTGVLYGKWDKDKYVLISRPDGCGEFLFPRKRDANGNDIIPDGWWTEEDENLSIELFLREEGLM